MLSFFKKTVVDESSEKDGSIVTELSETQNPEEPDRKKTDPLVFLSPYFAVEPFDQMSTPKIDPQDFISIIDQLIQCLTDGPPMVRITAPCNVIGSVGGRFEYLVKNLNCRRRQAPDEKYVFLGKFIDEFTEDQSVDNVSTLYFLFSLKVAFPEQTILVRGSSERIHDEETVLSNSLENYLLKTFGKMIGEVIYYSIVKVFSLLPLACLINEKILCVSGGISPHLNSLADIDNIQMPLFDIASQELVLDLTSSQPIWPSQTDIAAHYTRSWARDPCEFSFQLAVRTILKLGISYFLRSGRVDPETTTGYDWGPRTQWCSISSTMLNMKDHFKTAAIMKISEQLEVNFSNFRRRKQQVSPAVSSSEEAENEEIEVKNGQNLDYSTRFKINYTKTELLKLCLAVMPIFEAESALCEISPPLTIVGDIHGQFKDLLRILNAQNEKKQTNVKRKPAFACKKFVFLGDYVDRGNRSIECISLVFTLKILFPNSYVLLRGNHETKTVNCSFGFRGELIKRLGKTDGSEVWEKMNEVFAWMPFACLVGRQILCMHGGISSSLTKFDDIRKIRRPLVDVTTDYLAMDLVWADPLDYSTKESHDNYTLYLANGNRGVSCYFNESAVKECCQTLDIQLVVRAHQMVEDGFKFYADRKMVTLFSAPKYMQEYDVRGATGMQMRSTDDNKGAVLRVAENGGLSVVQMGRKQGMPSTPMESTSRGSTESTVKPTMLKKTASASISPSPNSS